MVLVKRIERLRQEKSLIVQLMDIVSLGYSNLVTAIGTASKGSSSVIHTPFADSFLLSIHLYHILCNHKQRFFTIKIS